MTGKKISEFDNSYAIADADKLVTIHSDGTFKDEIATALEVAAYVLGKVGLSTSETALDTTMLDADVALTANSDTKIATQKAVKAYVDAVLGAANAVVYKGVIDCSANPNYPAADAGFMYVVSVAGKIGGGSGTNVEAGDLLLCKTDSTASGTQAGVGANWDVIQKNLDGAVIGPASSVLGNLPKFSDTSGKLIEDSGIGIANSIIRSPSVSIDGNGSVIATGAVGAKITFPYACTLTTYFLDSDLTGNVVIDVKRSGTSIVGGGGNKPTITGGVAATAALAGWTSVIIAAGDTLTFNVDTNSAAKHIDLVLKGNLSS